MSECWGSTVRTAEATGVSFEGRETMMRTCVPDQGGVGFGGGVPVNHRADLGRDVEQAGCLYGRHFVGARSRSGENRGRRFSLLSRWL